MTIWIVPIEAHEQRYTREWQDHLPLQIAAAATAGRISAEVRVVGGGPTGGSTTPGAFLNFWETILFKSLQTAEIARLFMKGEVRADDTFLFADAWHPGAIQVRYMSELAGPRVRLIGLWHAGQYDEHDFLGRLPNRRWAADTERALFKSFDLNCFATQFHVELFKQGLDVEDDNRICQVGWPMEYLRETLAPYADVAKRNLILFPHRLAPEKQVDIFRDLAGEFPDYEFRVCQDTALTKPEYHRLLAEAKMVFSASLQETLGIGCFEGLLCGAIPLAPDRLSYVEMYPPEFLYPSEWTRDWASYQRHKAHLVRRMRGALVVQEHGDAQVRAVGARIADRFFNGHHLYELLLGSPSADANGKAIH